MAQYTVSSEQATPTAEAIPANAPLSLSLFGLTTVILGCIFAGFIMPGVGVGISLFVAAAFFGDLTQLLTGLRDIHRGQVFMGIIFAAYGSFLMILETDLLWVPVAIR